MDDTNFLVQFPSDNASLIVVSPDGSVCHVDNLNTSLIAEKCPLLALSFEQGISGTPKASVEASSRTLVVCFLRFIYLGEYLVFNDLGQLPCSLLLHAELCRMAEIYELPELQVVAHANIIRDTEFSLSQPIPPLDLPAAIQYIYDHLSVQKPLIETILNYCCHAFQYHSLGSNEAFRNVAFQLRQFHRDLCRTNYRRGFQDKGATDIVQLPVCRPNPHSDEEHNKRALGDFLFELWCDSDDGRLEMDTAYNERNAEATKRFKRRRMYAESGGFTLVHRPKGEDNMVAESEEDSSSDDAAGFTIVHRPRFISEIPEDGYASETDFASHSDNEPHTNTNDSENLEDSFITIKPSSRKNKDSKELSFPASTSASEPVVRVEAKSVKADKSGPESQELKRSKSAIPSVPAVLFPGFFKAEEEESSESEWSVIL